MFLIVLPDPVTEDILLLRLQRGSEEAVIAVYEEYFPALYQYARLKVGDSAQAKDIVSEVFVRLIESLGTRSAPRVSLRGWLFKVTRHEIYRSAGRMVHLPLDDVEEWMAAPEHESEMSEGFDLERVRHALRMLTADHQEVLILRFGQHLSLKETADIMGKGVSAVKSLQFRAVDTLRSILVEMEASNG
jgi:RNA polymerase sigma-70 factor, ECF subfamily